VKRTALIFPVVAAVVYGALPAPAPARTPDGGRSPLLGAWLIEGRDLEGASFSGVMELGQGIGGMTYTRRLLAIDGTPVTTFERGEARLANGFLLTRESEPEFDLVNALDGVGAPTASRRRAFYRLSPESATTLDGKFVGSSLRGGSERLRRSGADNQVDLLVDGPEAFPTIYRAIRSARRQICLQTFSWFDDAAGRELADLLIAKRREGVEVRCLVEAFPQKGGLGWKTGKHLRENGVEVIIHHKLSEGLKNDIVGFGKKLWRAFTGLFKKRKPEPPTEARGFFNHDHRKLIVVDGAVAFTGGMNIGDKYLQGTTWHDLHCRVEGSAVPELERLFWDRWHVAGGKGQKAEGMGGGIGPGSLPVEVLENLPGVRLDVTDRYLREIDGADREILIENAYMLYDPIVNALKRKAQQGVRVAVILPSNDLNDEALARDAFLWVQDDVLRSGVELYKYRQRMSHGKVAVFDGATSTIGTTNLDQMACVRNAEINLFIQDRGFARTMTRRVFDADIPNSDRIAVGAETKQGWWRKVVSGIMHSIRSFL
jgi:cardiolipin synthase